MSYTGLIANANHPQAAGEQLLDQIIFFIVQGGAAKMGYGCRLHQRFAVTCFLESALPALPYPIRNHVHSRFQIKLFPLPRIWTTISHAGKATWMSVQLVSICTLGTKTSTRNRRFRIAF